MARAMQVPTPRAMKAGQCLVVYSYGFIEPSSFACLGSKLALGLTLGAHTKDLQSVSDVRVTHLPNHPLQSIRKADIQSDHTRAIPADHMMMMMLPRVELVPVNSITKVTAPNQIDLFQSSDTAVDGNRITNIFGKPLVQFIYRERPVFTGKQRENFPARRSDSVPKKAEFLQRMLQVLVTATPVGMGAIVVGHLRTVLKSVVQPKPQNAQRTRLNATESCGTLRPATQLDSVLRCQTRLPRFTPAVHVKRCSAWCISPGWRTKSG
jgi:hypothetical protein